MTQKFLSHPTQSKLNIFVSKFFISTSLKTATTMSEYKTLKIIPCMKISENFRPPEQFNVWKMREISNSCDKEKLFSLHVDNFQSFSCRNRRKFFEGKRQKLNPYRWQTSAETFSFIRDARGRNMRNQIMMKTPEKVFKETEKES